MTITGLSDLLDVQAIDLEIDRLLHRRGSLPELEEYRLTHEGLQETQAERDAAAATLKEIELALDKSEGELEILENKLKEHETRLFAGGMSGRETEYMRLEVQGLRGQREAMELRVLQMLEDIEPSRDVVADLDSRIESLEAVRARLDGVIRAEWKEIDAALARKEAQKVEAVAGIASDLISLYEQLRDIKEGVAIAAYEHNVCGGCHMTLSPAEHEEAFAEELPRCVHCRRILVA
jgi:uncharacterized protein